MNRHHELTSVLVSGRILSLLVDGTPVSHDLRTLSPLLQNATDEELGEFEVSPSGYGIHWPRIDEDISIDGLLGIIHTPDKLKVRREG
jgi:hypothetical protein